MNFHFHKKDSNQGGNKYFQNSRNAEVTELQDGLNSMKIDIQMDHSPASEALPDKRMGLVTNMQGQTNII